MAVPLMMRAWMPAEDLDATVACAATAAAAGMETGLGGTGDGGKGGTLQGTGGRFTVPPINLPCWVRKITKTGCLAFYCAATASDMDWLMP